jgi:hypothetical protein
LLNHLAVALATPFLLNIFQFSMTWPPTIEMLSSGMGRPHSKFCAPHGLMDHHELTYVSERQR